jgi:hypothetical protein
MFDPNVAPTCNCERPDCPARILYAQRVRTLPDPGTGEFFVHPDDVVECLIATANALLDQDRVTTDLSPLLTAAEFLCEWMSDAEHHVPAGYTVAPEATTDRPPLTPESTGGDIPLSGQLDAALQRILDEG